MSRSSSSATNEERENAAVAEKKEKVKVTPLPKTKMIALAAVLFSESICSSMLLPFVGLYVAHLQGVSTEDAGYFSGILIGLYMLGQVISTKLWGWMSDVYGRKGPLLIGIFAGAFAILFFGMAPNFYICSLMRFIHGFFNGNVLIAKVIITDITDKTNAPVGFSMIGVLWSIGCLIGPALGGFLYDPLVNPKLQWLHVKEGSFLGNNPAFFPGLFVFVYALVSCVFCAIVLPETNVNRTRSMRNFPVIGFIMNRIRPKRVTIVDVNDASPAPVTITPREVTKGMSYVQALKDPIIRTVTILYMCLCSTDMAFVQVLPLYCVASSSSGGLGMFSDTVGMLMIGFSVPTLLSNMYFPKLYRLINNNGRMWRFCITVYMINIIIMPFLTYLPPNVIFVCVLITGGIRSSAGSMCFNLSNLQIAKAAPAGTVGSVYGISQSLSIVVRCIVPFIVAPIFAWSLSNGYAFPFNHCFVFFLAIIPTLFSIYLTLTRKLERTEEDLARDAELEADNNNTLEGQQANLRMNHGHKEEDVDDLSYASTVDDEEETRSITNSIALTHENSAVLTQINDMELMTKRKEMMKTWARRTEPRGRGRNLTSSAKHLQREEWRLVSEIKSDDDILHIDESKMK